MGIASLFRIVPRHAGYACAWFVLACGPAVAKSPSSMPPKANRIFLAYASTANSVGLPDGRTIHMTCMGHGSPTVVLLAGLGNWGEIWFKVQPAIAKHARVCAWDRAGFGLSSASPVPQTIDNTTKDLADALKYGHIRAPYVMVGHSLGGLEAMLYADRHPSKVAGMVLVDSSYPGMERVMKRVAPAGYAHVQTLFKAFTAHDLRCAADARAGRLKQDGANANGCLRFPQSYPAHLRERLVHFDLQHPEVFKTRASLNDHVNQDTRIAENPSRNYGAMPLVVLVAGEPPHPPPGTPAAVRADIPAFVAVGRAHHQQLARLSTRGVFRVVKGSGHYIQIQRPRAVINAVDKVIVEIRKNTGSAL